MDQKLKNIKAIFLDIDGTLCTSKKEVTEYTKSIINKVTEQGIYAILCSGRSNLDICELCKEINLSKYVIACNGAFVYNYKDNINIFEKVIKKETLEKLLELCGKENFRLILEAKEKRFGNFVAWKGNPKKYIKINKIEDIYDEKIYQVVIDSVEINKKEKAKEKILSEEEIWTPNYGKHHDSSEFYFFDINNKNIDKGIGIKYLINNLGIKKEQTIGFGDGVNDCAMFRECGIGVAMGNAEEELKKIADYITLSNDEDGVAKFIEKYILEG